MMVVEKNIHPLSKSVSINEFTFPRGVAGFPAAHRFGFIYEGQGNMLCMQSLDLPEASFILTPWDSQRLGKQPTLTAEQRACLKITANEDALWMLVLNPFADKTWVTANLKAPIAINESAQTGLQCILNDQSLELRYRWMPQPTKT